MNKFVFFFFVILSVSGFSSSHRAHRAHKKIETTREVHEAYRNVHLLPFDDHGWYQNGAKIERLFKSRPHLPKVVVEVGSWLGSSTRHIASLLPKDGIVYAVDHWLGSAEHQDGMSRPLESLYDQFLSNVIHAGLTHKIIPVRMSSLEAASTMSVIPDIVYLDASHDYESVYKDISAWFPFVKGHGILCGDDWWWDSVLNAVVQYAKDHNLRIVTEGNFWYYEEP